MGRKRAIAISLSVGLGLIVAISVSGVASARPGGVAGLSQRIEVVRSVAHGSDLTEVTPTCHSDEILTGGGYQVGSIGFSDKVIINAPRDDKTWLVEMFVDGPATNEVDVWGFAVCLGTPGGR